MTAPTGDTIDSAAQLKRELRTMLRLRRKALSQAQRRIAAQRAADHFLRLPALRSPCDVAVYHAVHSELDTRPLITALLRRGHRIYLPRLRPDGLLAFHRLSASLAMQNNRHGIAEPSRNSPILPLARLRVIVQPLLGFDRHGLRLGAGGGWYDRTLARLDRHWRPLLVGYAYQCQRVDELPREPWDQSLDAVCTETGWHRMPRTNTENRWLTGC